MTVAVFKADDATGRQTLRGEFMLDQMCRIPKQAVFLVVAWIAIVRMEELVIAGGLVETSERIYFAETCME